MRCRVTDERNWTHEFEAKSPRELRRGVLASWRAYVDQKRPGAGEPLLAYRRRMTEIDAWEAERLARPDSTADQRRSWASQAAHWRYQAKTTYGGDPHQSPLHLHVFHPLSRHWLSPGNRCVAPRVGVLLKEAETDHLLEECQRILDHADALAALCNFVAEEVFSGLGKPQAPHLRLLAGGETSPAHPGADVGKPHGPTLRLLPAKPPRSTSREQPTTS